MHPILYNLWYNSGMEKNNIYNLMHQLTQESKSLWRITNNYTGEALSDEEKMFALWDILSALEEILITYILKIQNFAKEIR